MNKQEQCPVVERVYRQRDVAAYNAMKDFMQKLLNPEKHFGLDMEDARNHAIVTKVYQAFMKSVVDNQVSLSFRDLDKRG